jgi:hypothetical protein
MYASECHGTTSPTRRTIAAAATAALCLMLAALSGCTEKQAVHQVGEKVQLGGVVYSVLDTEWASQLETGGAAPRLPQHRFLIVRVNVNNAGNREVNLPLLHLVGTDKAEHLELNDGQGVSGWMGILRTLNPTESKDGRLLFDVPVTGSYSLRLTDGSSEVESEKTAMVVLPASGKHSMESPLLNDAK